MASFLFLLSITMAVPDRMAAVGLNLTDPVLILAPARIRAGRSNKIVQFVFDEPEHWSQFDGRLV